MSHSRILRILFLVYCALLAITLWRHEMWRDELEAWNIATSSATIVDLFHNFRYEGHPSLWFIVLWLLSKISHAPEMMQVINFVFSGVTAWLILFRSPFTTFQKVLLIFGYYLLYEYAAISRNYMIEVMMVMMMCMMWKNPVKNFCWLLILLFIICQTNAYGYLFSISFSFALFMDGAFKKKFSWLKASAFLFAAASGFAVAYISSVPPRDSEIYLPIHFAFDYQRFVQVFTNCWNAFIPLPRFQFPFWSEPWLKTSLPGCILGLLILLVIVFSSSGKIKLLFTFLIPAFLLMLALQYFKYPGFQRHYGHLFIAFIAFLWLSKSRDEPESKNSFGNNDFLFNGFLAIQFLIGISFMISDWILPFSNGKKTAAYIGKNFLQATVASYTDCPAQTIAGYLKHDVYFLNNLRDASFVVYRTGRLAVEDSDITRNFFTLADSAKFLVAALNLNLQIDGKSFLPAAGKDTMISYNIHSTPQKFLIRNKAHFFRGMVGGEDFSVYEIEKE